jgi:hypothetical protein
MARQIRVKGSVGATGAAALVLLLGLFGSPALARHATKPLPHVTVTGRVLVGDPKSFVRVGTVDRAALFPLVPAFKELRRTRVPKDSAQYHFLLYEANRQFQQALVRAAKVDSVDLVVEAGGVRAAGIDVADLTARTRIELGAPR